MRVLWHLCLLNNYDGLFKLDEIFPSTFNRKFIEEYIEANNEEQKTRPTGYQYILKAEPELVDFDLGEPIDVLGKKILAIHRIVSDMYDDIEWIKNNTVEIKSPYDYN